MQGISVGAMRRAISALRADATILAEKIGNKILFKIADPNGRMVGTIDALNGSFYIEGREIPGDPLSPALVCRAYPRPEPKA